MKKEERNLIDKLMEKNISNSNFLEQFTVNVLVDHNYLIKLLEEAYMYKEADDVEYCLYVGFVFELFSNDYLPILCKLLEAPWHCQHEDIAMILQKLKSPDSVEVLFKTTFARFDYLDYDESFALAVKCIWALGDTRTKEAKEKLRILARSDNKIIKDNAEFQLKRDIW